MLLEVLLDEKMLQSFLISFRTIHPSAHSTSVLEVHQSMPETIKLTAELGYELLGLYISYIQTQEVHSVWKEDGACLQLVREIECYLMILLQIVHQEQVSIVNRMLDDFRIFISSS
jgi:hypothetical protein